MISTMVVYDKNGLPRAEIDSASIAKVLTSNAGAWEYRPTASHISQTAFVFNTECSLTLTNNGNMFSAPVAFYIYFQVGDYIRNR